MRTRKDILTDLVSLKQTCESCKMSCLNTLGILKNQFWSSVNKILLIFLKSA